MKPLQAGRQFGIAIIEALVALLIVSLGMVALLRLNALIINNVGESRARSEAVQIGEQVLESVRAQLLAKPETTPTIPDDESKVSGSNAEFTVGLSASGSEPKIYTVTVSWTSPSGAGQEIKIGGKISTLVDLRYSAKIDNDKIGKWSGQRKSPAGQARKPNDSDVKKDTGKQGIWTDDSTKKTYLADSSGNTLLVLDPDESGYARSFSTISGTLYLKDGINKANLADFEVDVSTGAVCLMGKSQESSDGFSSIPYTCYMGEDWYGNIGLYNAGTSTPRYCLGSNNLTATGNTTTAHLNTGAMRGYRGFKQISVDGVDSYLTQGITMGALYPTDLIVKTAGTEPSTAGFGKATAGFETPASGSYYSHNFYIINSNKQCSQDIPASDTRFGNNAGDYFCLSYKDNDGNIKEGHVCPAVWPLFGKTDCLTKVTVNITDSRDSVVDDSPNGACIQDGKTTQWKCEFNDASGTTIKIEVKGNGNKSYTPPKTSEITATCAQLDAININ